jgi:hypothetical protein
MNSKERQRRHDHERSDWDLKYVIWGAITLAISVSVIVAGSWWIFRNFENSAATRVLGTAPAQPLLPPEPRLQISPSADWRLMFEQERAALNSYGWVDRSRGIVRIPIDREMELIAQRGFPAAKAEGGIAK